MGKNLIVKGADFSVNGLDSTWKEASFVQGYVNTNSGSTNYGRIYLTGSWYVNALLAKILIPSGQTMAIKVTNNDVQISDLLVSYVAGNNAEFGDGNVVSGISADLHPVTDSIRDSGGTFTITNATANDLYYFINFCYDIQSGPAVPTTGKKIIYQRQNVG